VRLALALVVLGVVAPVARAEEVLKPRTRLWVDPNSSTRAAAGQLAGVDRENALRLAKVPSATWFTGGSAAGVRADAHRVTRAAARARGVPVIVAYDIPGRDCGEYSAGGAAGTRAYQRWIDGLARGIGSRTAVVILEPDGIAQSPEDCGAPPARQQERNAQMRYAVQRLQRLTHTAVYLDGGHSHWQPAAEMAKRLKANDVKHADGFFLNVSNFRTNAELIRYGNQVSQRISGQHFVIDTSRNGQGPWTPPAGKYGDAQDWCNPPGRGLGERPRITAGKLDAKLWIKTPGESDGPCTRGTPGPRDPEWGLTDPPAGAWFPQQAAQLLQLSA
jgi:endoglucanase